MIQNQYSSLLLEQTKDLIWVVDHHFCLVYANKAYLHSMKEVTGKEKKLNELLFEEGFGNEYTEKWKAYYERGLSGEQFEIEEHFFNPSTNQFEYNHISFNPIRDEQHVVVSVACQSRNSTSCTKSKRETEQLLDTSLDVICSIDEKGNFSKVSAACKELWGYEKDELIGKAFSSFVIEEDLEKTNQVKSDISEGKLITTFKNRYRRKDGGIAFNLWSVKWDPKTKIMIGVARDGSEKTKKEEVLIERENRLNAPVHESSDLIAILDEAGGIMNYLKTREGKAIDELLELSAIRKNDEEFPSELTAIPIKQSDEEFFRALIRDITQREKAEQELLNALNEKNSILERITEAFVALDANWCFTYMNKKAGEIFNTDPEKIIGKHIWTEFPEGRNQSIHFAYEKAFTNQEYIYLEEHFESYGSWLENHIYPSKDGISIFFKDVTARKRSEKKLELANERFKKVTEATDDVIWDWDIETGIFYRSNAIDNFFGVGTSKVMGKKDFWKDKFHKDDISKIKDSIEKALEDPNCDRWEEKYRILNNKNEIVFVIDRGLILRNNNGKAIRMVGVMTNITEQKKQEEKLIELNQSLNEQAAELKRSNEELEQFAFVASHDLQEPLRMIICFLDKIKHKYTDRFDEKGLQYIHFATDGAKRMKQIILDLLLYSRANKPTEHNELINLNEIVSEYTQLRTKIIEDKKASITFHELPSIETYRAPITQIFHCLLDNALKYVDENKPPRIEINAIEKENVWQFTIKDNGIGIDPMYYHKIFIIFQRLQNRKEHDGTGIGLAIVKRSIEFLGGEIWVESEKDKGSNFHFTILKNKQLN